jgi:hypothetical protein
MDYCSNSERTIGRGMIGKLGACDLKMGPASRSKSDAKTTFARFLATSAPN